MEDQIRQAQARDCKIEVRLPIFPSPGLTDMLLLERCLGRRVWYIHIPDPIPTGASQSVA